MASGSSPQNAWYLLSPAMRAQFDSREAFAAKFENVLWYERDFAIQRVEDPTTFNRFTVRFLAFTGKDGEHPDEAVNDYTQDMQLTRTGTVTQINDIAPATRSQTYTWFYPRVRTATVEEFPGPMRGYGGPSKDVLAGADPTLTHGGHLRPICRLQTGDGTWVYAPPFGWIPHEFLDGGTRDLGGMAFCDKHLVVRSQPVLPAPSN